MVRFGVPGQNVDPTSYADSRLATVPVIQAPRRPTVNDKKFPMWCEWRVNKNASAPATEGEFWKLIRFESNGDANWSRIDVAGSSPGIDDLLDQVDQAVGPDGSGQINIDGVVVANAANPSGIPVETVANTGTNTLDIQVQVATDRTGAPGDSNDAGICSFSDTYFTVDADGYVTLSAAGASGVVANTGDDSVQVAPDGSGDFFWIGSAVANATHAKPVYFKDSATANAIDLDVQVAAAVTGAPGDTNDAGICSFDDTNFAVDADGYVTFTGTAVPTTITGDAGGALPPSLGNWNIIGGAGVTTTGSGSTLTINSVAYTDIVGSTTVDANNGFMSTASSTLTLPATPSNGTRCEFIASTADTLVIQAPGTAIINVGSTASSAGGTATSNAKGDALALIYQSSTDDWWVTSVQGVWTIA